jgi:hypothetical protein
MRWFFDSSTGRWYVAYGLPNTDRELLFEADPDQLDALFGPGQRPTNFEDRRFASLTQESNITFAGNIAEMEGRGSFEEEFNRVIALALDEGRLPEWAEGDQALLDLLFIAQAEGKSQDWLLDQISQTDSFKARFPGLNVIQKLTAQSLPDAITGFLEYEAGVKQSLLSVGKDVNLATPEVIGGLLQKGYTLATVQEVTGRFRRMEQFAPAMEAFNQILAANEQEAIGTLQQMYEFLGGTAPAEMYDLWEASSISEAAAAAGLEHLFTAEDAMSFALETEGVTTLADASGAFQEAARLLLRFRHEISLDEYGISTDDLIDYSLGRPLRDGTDTASLAENMNRAILQAQSTLAQRQSSPFFGFTPQGAPQAISLGTLSRES